VLELLYWPPMFWRPPDAQARQTASIASATRKIRPEESVNPLEMYRDHSVRKKNLGGAQRLARAKEIPMRDATQLETRTQLDAVWAIGTELDKTVKSIEQKRIRRDQEPFGDRLKSTSRCDPVNDD
jgi:hypothetical protein